MNDPSEPDEQPQSKFVAFNKESARRLLATSENNRPINWSAVTQYARDMAAGQWQMNGEAIKVSISGRLLDGQHRLHAVIESGVEIVMLVIYGLDESSFESMDRGKVRTYANNLCIRDPRMTKKDAAVQHSIGNLIFRWRPDTGNFRTGMSVTPTTAELNSVFSKYRDRIEESAGLAIAHKITGLPMRVVGFAHWLLAEIDPEDARQFMEKLASGADLKIDNPIFALRERLIRDRTARRRLDPQELIALVAYAWNAWRDGRGLNKLQLKKGRPRQVPELS